MGGLLIFELDWNYAALYQNRRKTPCFNYGDIRR